MKHLQLIRRGALALLAAAALAPVALAQTPPTGCAPAASAGRPVVNTGLPVVQIWTENAAPVVDKENYVKGCLRITDGSVMPYGQGLFHGTIRIKGRGNTTWNMPKKGYRLKLDSAAPVLDMPAHKDWVLLANYADKTLMRNAVAMELSRLAGFAWTPRLRYAEFYLNDEFLGNYLIGEKIEVAPQRVPITPMTTGDNTLPNLSGGYLLETEFTDRLTADDRWFSTSGGINFIMQSPSGTDVTSAQHDYMRAMMQRLEDTVLARNSDPATGYPSLIDIDTLVNWFIVEELMKNVDAGFGSSVYLYKERGAKLKMGPLWDFDITAGNVDYIADAIRPTGWLLPVHAPWVQALMADPTFKRRLQTRWGQLRRPYAGIGLYIEALRWRLHRSQAENFRRWPILNTYVWPNAVVLGSHDKEVDYLKSWLNQRVNWLDRQLR